ncbi:MAG: DUF5615 family PIN-like protein [Burkholderiales bacterium]
MNRLLLDQGLPRSAAQALRKAGWDVSHASEIGLSRASDLEILAQSRLQTRVCVTLDADFHALLAISGANSPSAIRIRQQGLTGERLASLLQRIWPRIEQALTHGALVTVTQRALRIRELPVIREKKRRT